MFLDVLIAYASNYFMLTSLSLLAMLKLAPAPAVLGLGLLFTLMLTTFWVRLAGRVVPGTLLFYYEFWILGNLSDWERWLPIL